MKSMYEWVELMTKERLDVEAVETYVTRCNTPHLSRAATPRSHALSPAHRAARASPGHSVSPTPSLSRPLSVISEDLASSLSQSSATVSSSASPPLRGAGGVFSTLYRPRPGAWQLRGPAPPPSCGGCPSSGTAATSPPRPRPSPSTRGHPAQVRQHTTVPRTTHCIVMYYLTSQIFITLHLSGFKIVQLIANMI